MLVNGLGGSTETHAGVLQKNGDGINVIAEGNQQFTTTYGQAFYNNEFNRAFVQLEYFGYMKRDPDDGGYAFWLTKLNLFGGNFVNAERYWRLSPHPNTALDSASRNAESAVTLGAQASCLQQAATAAQISAWLA